MRLPKTRAAAAVLPLFKLTFLQVATASSQRPSADWACASLHSIQHRAGIQSSMSAERLGAFSTRRQGRIT